MTVAACLRCDKLFEIIAGVMRSIQPRLSQKLNVGECGTFFPIIFAILQSVAAKATLDFSAEEEEVPGQRVPLELQVAMVGLQVIIPNFTTVARTNPTVVEVRGFDSHYICVRIVLRCDIRVVIDANIRRTFHF